MIFRKRQHLIPLDLVPLPVITFDEQGIVREANAAFLALSGMDGRKLSGLGYRDIEYLKPLSKHIAQVFVAGKTHLRRHNLGDRYFEITISAGTSGSASGVSVFFYDISPFYILEQDLIKRNRELMIMNTLSSAFIASETREGFFYDLLEKMLMITDFSAGFIVLKTEEGYSLKSGMGISKTFQDLLTHGPLDSHFAAVETMADPISVLEKDDLRHMPVLEGEGISFLAGIPIRTGSAFKGIAFLGSRTERVLDFDLASILGLIGSQLSLIVEKIDLFEETRRLSITDSLTSLYNSRFFYQELEKEIARSTRYRIPFSLAVFDIDNFKQVNDTYGHQSGDDILIHIGAVLKAESRNSDIIARYGGEEFMIIFPNTAKEEALAVSQRILHAVNGRPISIAPDLAIEVTLSGGIASFPDDATTSRDILYRADMAMYSAKGAGKKRIVCYNKDHETDIQAP